jgi:Protein kinase domain
MARLTPTSDLSGRPSRDADDGRGVPSSELARVDGGNGRPRVQQATVRWGGPKARVGTGTLPYRAVVTEVAAKYRTELPKPVDPGGTLPVATAADFGIDACDGLVAVHGAGIVSRGLKPAKLFLTRKRSGSIRLKLLDSEVLAATPLAGGERAVTSTHALMGSPVYMAPEQLHSSEKVDARAEIWSLGVLLYELLSGGQTPFDAPTAAEVCRRVLNETPAPLSSFRPDLPLGLEAVVHRCLEKDPSRRFPSASSLAIALAPYASRRGQLCARRMQHPRSLERKRHRQETVNVAAHGALPLPSAPPKRLNGSNEPTLASAAPAGVSSTPRAERIARSDAPVAIPVETGRPSPVRMALPTPRNMIWIAVGLSATIAVLAVAVFVMAMRAPALPTDATPTQAGVANTMPEAIPAPSAATAPMVTASATTAPALPNAPAPMATNAATAPAAGTLVVPAESPASTERVYAPEELPVAGATANAPAPKPVMAAAPAPKPAVAAPAPRPSRATPSRTTPRKTAVTGPDGF